MFAKENDSNIAVKVKLGLSGIFLFFTLTIQATTHTVKQDGTGNYTLIQEAFYNAAPGDTILVYPGRYFENLTIQNSTKDIVIGSLFLTTGNRDYINNTIIDGNYENSTIIIRNSLQADITICGFTIEHGIGYQEHSGRGGGVYIGNANSTLLNCIIQNNTADGGGGIWTHFADIFLSDVTVRYNQSFYNGGGIVCGYESNVIFDSVKRCNIYLNYSPFGSDYSKSNYAGPQKVIIDTCTVKTPDCHFIYSYDINNFPVNDLDIDIRYGKLTPVDSDLYIDPVNGNDDNEGNTPDKPLKTISYALHLIQPDTIEPNNIYLKSGTYGPHTNGERFPLNGRTNVSLLGEDMINTIFDADSTTNYFFRAYGGMKNFDIRNITCINKIEKKFDRPGFYFSSCENINIDSIKFSNCNSFSSVGISAEYCDKMIISNCTFDENMGAFIIEVGNSLPPKKEFKINNCRIRYSRPMSDPERGGTDGIGVVGSLTNLLDGELLNVEISDNIHRNDPEWGGGGVVALLATYNTKLTLVNLTVGNNKSMDYMGFAVKLSEGALVDFYNCIMYGDSTRELGLGSHLTPSTIPATANVAYTNMEGGKEKVVNFFNINTLNWLDGNIDADPLWVGTEDSAYHLQWNSPCVNSGVPMYEPGMDYPYIKEENGKIVMYKYDGDTLHIPALDLAGNPRISGGRIDMGAYEYQEIIPGVQEIIEQEKDAMVYPNPFTESTYIGFKTQREQKVEVVVSDIRGRHIKTITSTRLPKGEYSLLWKGQDESGSAVPAGTYVAGIYLDGELYKSSKLVKKNSN